MSNWELLSHGGEGKTHAGQYHGQHICIHGRPTHIERVGVEGSQSSRMASIVLLILCT